MHGRERDCHIISDLLKSAETSLKAADGLIRDVLDRPPSDQSPAGARRTLADADAAVAEALTAIADARRIAALPHAQPTGLKPGDLEPTRLEHARAAPGGAERPVPPRSTEPSSTEPSSAERSVATPHRHWSYADRPVTGWDSLTDTEYAVSLLVTQGLTNQQVADQMYISVHTVAFHLRQIFRKLDIDSRVDLTRLAMERTRDR
jgi:DNA-binding CsgD family transcriptional regulator